MITAKVVCDSISPEGVRLTTLQLRYPRMIHADFMTHRVFSRNGRSSRAVPFKVLVMETPYLPAFCFNQAGMVAGEPLTGEELELANSIWMDAAEFCQQSAKKLSEIGGKGVHKQWVNRMLEWFGYIDVLVTSTDWSNFFELRDEDGAQPEIIELAKAMKAAINGSTPRELKPGQWHMPYIDLSDVNSPDMKMYLEEIRPMAEAKFPDWQLKKPNNQNAEMQAFCQDILKKVSVARCARLTIRPFDNDGSLEKELKRYESLMVSRPVHASPAEHIATPDTGNLGGWDNEHEHGNFYGWRQFRKQIPHNTVYDR